MRAYKSISANAVGILVWTALAIPIGSFLEAWSASKLWSWFCSMQYGAGPSIGVWFGVLSIADLVILGVFHTKNSKGVDKSAPEVGAVIGDSLGRWLFMGMLLVTAWGTGIVFGWIR